ncbi:MAG: formate dehydrogenase subunit alpha [Candidatus Omnitrophota bacterium]
MKTVTISINDKEYSVPSGSTILDACVAAKIPVPNLCFLKGVSEEASCSVCAVEVEGARTLVRSCVTKAAGGMIVRTETERVLSARKVNIELILANHPLDCMTCDADGDCGLQDLAYRYGIKKSRFLTPEKVVSKERATPWTTNPFIHFDPDKCILCGRCVNSCKNEAVLEAISFGARGHRQTVTTPFSMPLEDTGCKFCAVCVQACPVAALIEKPRMGKGRKKDLTAADTICAYCGVGCNIRLYKDRNEDLVLAEGILNTKVNNGRLCVKGRYGFEYINSGDRLTAPLIKENGAFRKASWEEAIRYTAKRLSEIKEKHGPDSIGVLGSSRCTNEDNYCIQKFSRAVIGTNNVDNCARLCHSSTVAGLGKAFGAGAATNSIQDIADADTLFIIGSNMTETHPVIAQLVKAHKQKNDPTIIVCDPRAVGITKAADIHIQHVPGTDVLLLNGIMKSILSAGLEKKAFIEEHTEGFDEFRKVLDACVLDEAAAGAGVAKEDIERAARAIGNARSMMIFFTMGITQHTTGVDNVLSVANLALLTGSIGRRGAGVMPLRGQANVQGSCDMGALPNVFPGYQKVTDSGVIGKFEKAWGVKLSDRVGIPVSEFAERSLAGEMKAVYIMGENPLMTEADITRAKEGFENLEFLAIQNIFLSETAEIADVVFPASAAYEKDGTFTNTDRTVQPLRIACTMPEGAKLDWQIVCELATAMGYPMAYGSTAEITDEIARLTPSYGGITSKRLAGGSIQWPCTDEDHPGTLFLYENGAFKRPNGKGLFSAISYKPAKELPDEEYPFILTTGRILYHFHSGNETRRVKPLNAFVPRNYIEMHPEDAEKLRVGTGDLVRASSRRGSIGVHVLVSERPRRGVVFIPFHFRESPANALTNPALDPVSKIPEFKVCAIKIVPEKKRKK